MKLAVPVPIFIFLIAGGAQAFVVAKSPLIHRSGPDLTDKRGRTTMKNSNHPNDGSTEKIQSKTWNPLRLAVLKVGPRATPFTFVHSVGS